MADAHKEAEWSTFQEAAKRGEVNSRHIPLPGMSDAAAVNALSILKHFKLCCSRVVRVDGVDIEMVTFPSLLNKQPADQWCVDAWFPYHVMVAVYCPKNMMVPPGVFVALQVAVVEYMPTSTLSANALVCNSGDAQLCVKISDDQQSLRLHARSIAHNRKAAFDVLITAIQQLAIQLSPGPRDPDASLPFSSV